jgi:glycosidase
MQGQCLSTTKAALVGAGWFAVVASMALVACGTDQIHPFDSGGFGDASEASVMDARTGGQHDASSPASDASRDAPRTHVDASGAHDAGKSPEASVDGLASDARDGGYLGDASDASDAPVYDGFVPDACPATFTLPDNGYTTVSLETDYNQWTTAIPMASNGSGTWTVTTPIPNGVDVEYKFVADGNWITNPADPIIDLPSLTEGMNYNNILQAVTCGGYPPGTLTLVGGTVTTTATSYAFQVTFTPGSAPLDPSKTVITLNGATLTSSDYSYNAAVRTFTVSVSSGVTSPNKYGYLFQVVDTKDNPARLFVPFWIGSTSFEWTDAFLYEVMVDRFYHGGTSLEGPNGPPTVDAGDWHGGDFGGVTQQIESGYFAQMGVNALWLSSPVLNTRLYEEGSGANAGYDFSSYHSYFPIATGWTYGSETDPMFVDAGIDNPIDPHFGTADDLRTLVNTAHQHGMRVLTDLVVNHIFGDSNPPAPQAPQLGPIASVHLSDQAWFNSPYSPSINDCGNENLWDTPETQDWNRADCWFDPYLPDLNSTDPTVDDVIANHAVWLMEQFNLDGFRVDAVKQVDHDLCLDMRAKVNAAVSTGLPVYMVGEALGSVEANVFDCVGDTMLNGSVDDGLHNTIVGTILQQDTSSEGAAQDLYNGVVYDEGSSWTGSVPGALMGHFFGSHDTPRAISLAEGDSTGEPLTDPPPYQETNPVAFQRLELAQTFLLTYDSIPILWMGDEFGQPGTIDPDCRRMMRFGNQLSMLESQTLAHLATLGNLRAAHPALRRGPRTNLWVDSVFYADGRNLGTDITVVALNLDPNNTQTRTMNVGNIGLTGTVTDAISGTMVAVAPGGGYESSLTITLAPLTGAVFTN